MSPFWYGDGMSTTIIDAGDCPGCHGDLAIEPDDRCKSGYALVCTNGDCSERDGCWSAPVALVQRLVRAGVLEGRGE